jgi:hypothetical protein
MYRLKSASVQILDGGVSRGETPAQARFTGLPCNSRVHAARSSAIPQGGMAIKNAAHSCHIPAKATFRFAQHPAKRGTSTEPRSGEGSPLVPSTEPRSGEGSPLDVDQERFAFLSFTGIPYLTKTRVSYEKNIVNRACCKTPVLQKVLLYDLVWGYWMDNG